MLKEILKFKDGKSLNVKYPIKITDSNGSRVVYIEFDNGYWSEGEYDANGYVVYGEDSEERWYKHEYDSDGNVLYAEYSDGSIMDTRPKKELSIKEIEKLLGYSIKITK